MSASGFMPHFNCLAPKLCLKNNGAQKKKKPTHPIWARTKLLVHTLCHYFGTLCLTNASTCHTSFLWIIALFYRDSTNELTTQLPPPPFLHLFYSHELECPLGWAYIVFCILQAVCMFCNIFLFFCNIFLFFCNIFFLTPSDAGICSWVEWDLGGNRSSFVAYTTASLMCVSLILQRFFLDSQMLWRWFYVIPHWNRRKAP
jgi:hypothetical protein